MVAFLLWDAWQKDYGPQRQTASTPPSQATTATPQVPAVGPINAAPGVQTAPILPQNLTVAPTTVTQPRELIQVITDIYDISIDSLGGNIVRVDLLKYPVTVENPNEPFHLMFNKNLEFYIAQSGLDVAPGSGSPAPTYDTVFRSEKTHYRMADNSNELSVPLTWQDASGVKITKNYRFVRGRYSIDVDHLVENQSAMPWTGQMYMQLRRTEATDSNFLMPTYTGGGIYKEESFEKLAFSDIKSAAEKPKNGQIYYINEPLNNGWLGLIQHYFVSAWIPPAQVQHHYQAFYNQPVAGLNQIPVADYIIRAASPLIAISPQQQQRFTAQLYAGPKIQTQLEQAAPGLLLTVDYGVLTPLSQPLFWLMDKIHSVVKNWGWSIVILTLMIKLVFYKLSEASYRSMANMKRLQPRIVSLKERYGDDRQRMSQAMMELYKKEKFNPLGGCLPILVQIPVFLALYWVLLESVELRQAPFMFWIKDLSTKDPFYVLPLLMGITMFLQQKLNPPQMDPLHQKIMSFLPVIFTLFIAFFPSGLVLYWVANNVLSIAQQWLITRRMDKLAASKSSSSS